MSEATALPAEDTPSGSRAQFYGIWVIAALALVVLPLIFSSGG